MAVMDIAGAMTNVKTMFSTLATWQSLTGSANATEALETIHKYAVDDSDTTPAPLILLDLEEYPTVYSGGKFQGPLTVVVRIELPIPDGNQRTLETQAEYMWTQLSALLAEIRAAVQDSGQLMLEGMSIVVKPGLIDPDQNQGRIEWMTQLHLEVELQ